MTMAMSGKDEQQVEISLFFYNAAVLVYNLGSRDVSNSGPARCSALVAL